MKKTLSLVLSLVMVLSLCAALCVPASAASENIAKGKAYTTSQLFKQGGKDVGWGWDENAAVAYPDEDGKSLTDGVIPASDAAYTDVVWAGFNHNSPDYTENGYSWITVDLGSVQNISKAVLCVGTSALGSGIGASNMTVEFFVSDDNQNWTSIGSAAPADIASSCVEAVTVEATASGRYVQARMVRGGWMFVSEVEVYGAASAPVVEDKVINLLAQAGTLSEANCEAGDLAYDWKAEGLEVKCLGTMWPNITIKFDAPVTIDVAEAYLEIEASVTGGNGGSIRVLGPVDDPGAVETDDIYLQHFDTDVTPDGGGDAPAGSVISYKLPVSELAYCIYDADHAYAGKNPITESEITITGLQIFASGKDCVVNITKLNLIVPGTSSAPSAPVLETITVDGVLDDNGWKADGWINVNKDNGTFQGGIDAMISEDSKSFSYSYQLRTDDTKLYVAAIYNDDLVKAGEANNAGFYSKFRIWLNTDSEATVYTHFYDIYMEGDEVKTNAKYNTEKAANKAANIENTTLVANMSVADGKVYFEMSVDLAEFGGEDGFDYFFNAGHAVDYTAEDGTEGTDNIQMLYPAVEIPTEEGANKNTNFPYSKWASENAAKADVEALKLGEVTTGGTGTPGTPETGDAGIYAIAGLALVALLGTAIVIKKRA